MNRLRDRLWMSGILACLGCSGQTTPEVTPDAIGATPAPAAGSGMVSTPPVVAGSPAARPSTNPATGMQPPVNPMPAAGSGAANPVLASAGTQAMQPVVDTKQPVSAIPAKCRGFEVLGLKTSPGGSTLPNTCAPFDGTLNNPYAIRCIDADPAYKTKYPGDEFCILPPPDNLGMQIHLSPDNAASPGKFELAAGAENSSFFYINSPNAEARNFYRTNWRMRPGGHHMLISMLDQDQADGWTTGGDMGSDFGGRGKSFGGAQRASVDRPQGTLDVPPENVGLGQRVAAHQQFSFNLHHINTTSAPVLREVWVNVWYVEDKDVTKPMQSFAGTGNPADMAVPAGQRVRLEYKCAVTGDTRIISLYGHYHAHGQRFGIWVTHPAGEKLSVYESFNWEDIPVYQYDTVSMNPVADVTNKVDGASSGTLALKAGDELHFECNIDNDSTRALRFADEAITGEMCIMFGSYTGANPCTSAQRVK